MPTSICAYSGASLGSWPREAQEVGQDVLDLAGDVAQQRAVGARARSRGWSPGPGCGSRRRCRRCTGAGTTAAASNFSRVWSPSRSVVAMVSSRSHLPVDHHRVEALLAAEVLVHHRLGHAGLGGDLLDRGALEPALGEQPPPDVEQLLPPLLSGHPLAAGSRRLGAHRFIMAPPRAPRHGLAAARRGHRAEFPGRGGGPLGAEPLLVGPADVVGPAQLLEPAR